MLKVTIKTIYDSLKKYASKIFVAKDITVEFDALTTIVGAGAIVSKTLPAHYTAVGAPVKVIKFHDRECGLHGAGEEDEVCGGGVINVGWFLENVSTII